MSEANVSRVPGRIVVPIDFSPSSHVAMETAFDLAGKFQAEVLLFHVLSETAEEAKKTAAEKNFALSLAEMESKGLKGATKIAVDDDIAGAILDYVEDAKADLVVISTHGVSGWYPVVFGSIAEKIARLIATPLYLLRTEKPETSVKIPNGRLMEWW